MNRCRALWSALLVAGLGGPLWARNMDGYYCLGPGYVAFELYSLPQGDPTPETGRREIRIVPYSAQGIGKVIVEPIEKFRITGMKCADQHVELATDRYVYDVDFLDPSDPSVRRDESGDPSDVIPEDFTSFDTFNNPQKETEVIPLSKSGEAPAFELRIERAHRPVHARSGELVAGRRNRATLIEKAKDGRTLAEQTLFDDLSVPGDGG